MFNHTPDIVVWLADLIGLAGLIWALWPLFLESDSEVGGRYT